MLQRQQNKTKRKLEPYIGRHKWVSAGSQSRNAHSSHTLVCHSCNRFSIGPASCRCA